MRQVSFFFLLFSLALMPVLTMGQYGPMGIGNADGSNGQPRLLLWLAGDSIEVLETEVIKWYDKSGNEHDFTPATSANRPKYLPTGGPSGKPAIQFDGVDDRMGFSGFPLSGNGYTIYFVYKSNDLKFGMFSYATTGQPNEVLIHYDDGFYQKHSIPEQELTILGKVDNTWDYAGLTWSRSAPTTGYQFTRAHQSESATPGLTLGIPGTTGDAVIGDIQHAGGFEPGDAFKGDIAEIIILQGTLSKVHNRMMRTYFWTKYGEMPDWKHTNKGWDKFKGYATGSNAKYDEVIGIGRYGSIGQMESRLKGIVLRMSPNLSGYGSNNYMFAGLVPDAGNSIVTSSADLPPGVVARWKRVWEIASDVPGSSNVLVSFDFGEGISGEIPQNADNFVLLRRANNSGTFEEVGGILEKSVLDDELVFRVNQSTLKWVASKEWHYTIGTTNNAESTLDGAPFKTWYCVGTNQNTHVWSDHTKWTLDGSTNPIYINPDEQIPQPGDNVVIGSGKAIKIDIDNLSGINRLTVNGTLNVAIAGTPEFGDIAGNGLIRCAGHNGVGNFPLGNTTEFADPSTGGTVEFYSTSSSGDYTQTTPLPLDIIEVNNLVINMNQTAHEITLAANLTHNGTFNLTRGTLIINDGSNLSRTITSNGRVAIAGNGIVKVCSDPRSGSNPNPRGKHRWFFDDDLYNTGQLIFTNRTAPNYSSFESHHWIEAHFTNDVKNQILTANGAVNNFSRIIVDKGIDDTYVLTLTSSGADKFQLFGGHVTTDSPTPAVPDIQDTNGDRNSIVIINGTLEVTSHIDIRLHAIAGNYSIGANGTLWINGGTVTKDVGTAIVIYGKVRVTAGGINADCNSGFTIRDNGILQVDGGIVNANQIRTSVYGPTNIGGVIINGGTTTVNGAATGGSNASYYTFSLTYPGNLFQMTGGVLRVKGPTSKGLIFINSDPQNTSVSGGKVIAEVATTSDHHRITSRADFWHLDIERTISGTNRAVKIQGGTSFGQTLPAMPLVIKGNLTIKGANDATLNTLASAGVFADVHIHGNLTIQNGGVYIHNQNTTFFEGNANSNISLPPASTQTFYNVVVNKSSESRYAKINGGNGTRAMEVQGLFDIQNGYFDNTTRHVSIKGDLINSSFMGDPSGGSNGVIVMEGSSEQTITSFNGVFHNLKIDNTAGVTLLNDGISVRRSLNMITGNFFIDSYKVRIEGANGALAGSGFNNNKCFVTNGQPSAGGLELVYKSAAQNSTFPMGVKDGANVKYTPTQIRINSGFVDEGYIRVIPVNEFLPTVDLSVGDPYLDFYWRVLQSDFDNIPMVSHMFQYDDMDVIGNEDSLASGRVLTESPFIRSVDSLATHNDHVNTTANRVYYNSDSDGINANLDGIGTLLVNADYSAGNRFRFEGRPKVYYSKSSTFDAIWDDAANWNELFNSEDDPYVLHSAGYNTTQNGFPESGDIAYIGFDPLSGRPHVYGAPTEGITASRVNFTYLQDSNGNRLPRYYASGTTIESVVTLRPSLRFSTTAQIEKILEISGEGSLILAGSNIDLNTIDIGGFLAEDASIVVLQGVSTMSSFPAVVPNLLIAANSSSLTQINSQVEVRGNLEIIGNVGLYLSSGVNGDFLVKGDLLMDRYQLATSSPSIRFPNNSKRMFEVRGDVHLSGNGAQISVFGPNTSNPALNHDFIVWKNIFQDSNGSINGLRFYTYSATLVPHSQRINLILRGDENHQFVKVGGGDPSLGRIVLEKGINTNSSFSFNSFISVNGEASGTEKPIELISGKLILNDPDIDITLSSLGSFIIPVEAGIKLEKGKLRVNGTGTGVLLAGSLEIDGGLFEIGNTEGEDNFIEYAPSGIPKLYINGGVLSVGSQIRTDLTSGNGNLDYRQTGGELMLGRYSAPITAPIRPVFEVKGNLGSRFNHTGGTITFVRGLNHSTQNSIYLAPQYNVIGGDAKIVIGSTESPVGGQIKNFGISSSIALNKLFLDNTSGNGPEVRLVSPGLTLLDTLSIATGTMLTAGNFPVYLNGDFYNGGKIIFGTHNNAVLTLNHSSTKKVWGSGQFGLFDLVRTGGPGGLTDVESNLDVARDFSCDSGEMDFGANSISVKRNVVLDGHLSFDSGTGLVLNGNGVQKLDRTGPGISEIDILTIENGVLMTPGAGYELYISKEVLLKRGVLGLQGNLLSLGESCVITPLNPYSSSNMISTFGSNSNFGVKKYFSNTYSDDFTLPIGVTTGANRYTPVTFWFDPDKSDNTGSAPSSYLITLTPDYHEIIVRPSSKDSVLSMYFSLDANIPNSDAQMNVDFQYDQSFVPVNNLEPDYIAARVYSIGAVDFVARYPDADAVDDVDNVIRFRYNSYGEDKIIGDYFAGVDEAIPGEIRTFNTKKSGFVADDTYLEEVDGAPSGARVNIRNSDTLTFDDNGITFYRTDISEDGVLEIDATNFHRLGRVTGTGTIKLVGSGDLPSGNYQEFFKCDGGKLTYEGRANDDFQILANQPSVRKVDVIGDPGSVLTVANNNVFICEDFTIDGPVVHGANNMLLTVKGNVNVESGTYDLGNGDIHILGNLAVTNTGAVTAGNSGATIVEGNLLLGGSSFGLGEWGRETQVKGNINKTSGTIMGGVGGATLSLNGNSLQSITGDFTGISKIPTIEFDNSAGIELLGNVEISDSLKLSSGLIHTSPTAMLILGNDAVDVVWPADITNSYINGPMRWVLASNPASSAPSHRVFPIGFGGRYRPVNLPYRSGTTWEVQYYDSIALIQDPIITSLDLEDPIIETISVQEHWRIKGEANGSTAKVGLSWGENSAVSELPGDYQNLVVLEYNKDNHNWESRGADNSSFTYNQVLDQGSFTADIASSFSEKYFTLGSSQAVNPLPVTWLHFQGETHEDAHILTWATASEQNNDYFELERSIDTKNWTSVAKITGAGYSHEQLEYAYTDRDAPYGRVYYRIRQVDFDGRNELYPNLVTLERKLVADVAKMDFVLYPNPTNSQRARIMLPGYEDTVVSVSLTDMSGKVLTQEKVQIDGQGISNYISCNFQPGIYLVTVIADGEMRSKPLVITK